MKNLFNLENKIALITASSRGLGFVFAEGLAKTGVKVIVNGRNEHRVKQAIEKLKQQECDVEGYAFDVTDSVQVKRNITLMEENGGSIDVLVNNAGIHRRALLEELTEEDWKAVIDLNLSAAFTVGKYVAQGMIGRKRGKIINITSLMAEGARAATANYCAAKGGLKMRTKAMAVEWGKYNIQINAIGPGYFLTDLTKPLAEDPEFDTWVKGRTPIGRWGHPSELVGTCIFLASKASDFVNGQTIYVDGGWLAAL